MLRSQRCPAAHLVLLGSDLKTSKYEFATDDPIHLFIAHEMTKPGNVTASWWRKSANDSSGSGNASMTMEPAVSPMDFRIDPPTGGWNPADYVIEIRADGVLFAVREFRITEP